MKSQKYSGAGIKLDGANMIDIDTRLTFLVLVFFALIAPTVLTKKGSKAFLFLAVAFLLTSAAVAYPHMFLRDSYSIHFGEALANFLGLTIGFGAPIWGATIIIWILGKRGASLWKQSAGAILVGTALYFIELHIAFIVGAVLYYSLASTI